MRDYRDNADAPVMWPLGDPLPGHIERLWDVVCAKLPDGTPVALATGDGPGAIVWDLAARRRMGLLAEHSDIHLACVALPNGTSIAVSVSHEALQTWDLDTLSQRGSIPWPGNLLACATASDGTPVALIGNHESVLVWDLAALRGKGVVFDKSSFSEITNSSNNIDCAYLPDGRPLAVITNQFDSKHGTGRTFDVATGQPAGRLKGACLAN
jgi:WD40 repeat protein